MSKLLWLSLFFSFPVQAESRTIAQNEGLQVYALELFTSESCSSCPPADRHLSELMQHPELWKKYIPMAFHVDYWNHLSWKDRFSSEKMTERQSMISRTWGTQRIYTPAFVLNGKELANWRSTPLPSYQNSSSIKITISETKSKDLSASVEGLDPQKTYQLHMAILGFGIESKVTAGENQGEKLVHNFVVVNWIQEKISSTAKSLGAIRLSPSQASFKKAVVVWIEENKKPIPIQITGGYL